jgi:RNA polymerase sigma-70 factor (ECF subfamily)
MNVTANKINLESQGAVADSSDFEAAFLEQWSRVYRVLFHLLGDKAEAEDLALETFWQLYRKPPAKVENLNGWLYRVAVNLGFNALRAKKRRARYEEQAGSLALEANQPAEPEDELERAERRREVQLVLAQMKPRSAKLLVLRHSGLSYSDLAAVIKVKPTSVGKLLARAEDEFEMKYRQMQGE